MPFQPGMKKVPGSGRKPGTLNKRTQEINKFLDLLMSTIEKKQAEDPTLFVDEMGVKKMVETYLELLNFYKPKLATLKVDETSKKTINININGSK